MKLCVWILIQLISYKRYTRSMETIYLSLVHTGSSGYLFMKSPVGDYLYHNLLVDTIYVFTGRKFI